jgi:hypothetical protein
MIQNSTKYKNPQRKISGVGNKVTNADTILLCETSLGAVSLDLLQIPDDQWNTSYKLYVVDFSNNAGTNNITINAPVGFTINNLSSIVISTDGVGVVITVSSSTGYLGSFTQNTSGGGSVTVVNRQNPLAVPVTLTTALDKLFVSGFQTTNIGNNVYLQNAFVEITTSQLDFLIINSNLIPNQTYKISGFEFGNAPELHNVFIRATSNNTLEQYGTGEFYNADYDKGGDYSGVVPAFVGALGIWQPTLVVVVGNTVVWNNYNFVNITGVNTTTPPNTDTTNWTKLTYSVTNGYFLEYDFIIWLYGKAYEIVKRIDRTGNDVERFITVGVCSLNRFQWGKAYVNQNKVGGNSIFDCCNVIINNNMSNNIVFNTELFLSDSNQPSYFEYFQSNQFVNADRPLNIRGRSLNVDFRQNDFNLINIPLLELFSGTTFYLNNFYNASISGQLGGVGICDFRKNNCTGGTGMQVTKESGSFIDNNFQDGNVYLGNSTGSENNNTIISGSLTVQNNKGLISGNLIQNGSSIILNVVDVNGEIKKNSLDNGSIINISVELGNLIQLNTLENQSNVDVTTIDATGSLEYNTLNNGSSITVKTLLSGSIGNAGIKGFWNTLTNGSALTFDTFIAGKQIATNSFDNTFVEIETFNGGIFLSSFTGSGIKLLEMNSKTLTNLMTFNASLGTPTYILPQTFNSGQFILGIGSIKANLDCADPTIYDAGTFTLTIPTELNDFAGKFVLQNAGGRTIKKIVGLNTFLLQAVFTNDSGATTFETSAIAGAGGGDIVWNVPAPTSLTIIFRLGKTDYIAFKPSSSVNAITEVGIFL